MKTSEIIKQNRKRLGLTLEELGKRIGVSKVAVSKWESGETDNIKRSNLLKLADVLDVSPVELLGDTFDTVPDNIETEVVKIPIIGQIACGKPIMSDENIIGYEEEPASTAGKGESFYLQTEGDSMVPTIPIGSRVKIRIQPDVESGEIAAVEINGELTLKRIKKSKGSIMLVPDNRSYGPIILSEDDNNRIIGKAVKVAYDL